LSLVSHSSKKAFLPFKKIDILREIDEFKSGKKRTEKRGQKAAASVKIKALAHASPPIC
jgi:hypothetical protein